MKALCNHTLAEGFFCCHSGERNEVPAACSAARADRQVGATVSLPNSYNGAFGAHISEGYPEYVQSRLLIANYVSALVFLVAFIYTIVTHFIYLPLIYIPILGMVAVLSGVGLSLLGYDKGYRAVVSLTPVVLVVSYQTHLIPKGAEPIASISMLSMAFSLIGFIVFDLREWGYLSGLAAFNLLLLIFIPQIASWVEADLGNGALFRSGSLYYITSLVAVLLVIGSIFAMSQVNATNERKSEKLLEEAARNAALMAEKERNLEDSVQKLQESQEEDQRRHWMSEGLAKIGNILRDDQYAETDLMCCWLR